MPSAPSKSTPAISPPSESYADWIERGKELLARGRGNGFAIGDWINYGAAHWGDRYTAALESTGMDNGTLRTYASVAKSVDLLTRVNNLSFDHHRKVAALPPAEQARWLKVAAEQRLPTRWLQRSILANRVLTLEEMKTPPGERGLDSPIPHVNRLVALWRRMKDEGFLKNATDQQRADFVRDLQPVLDILAELAGAG